MPSLSVVNMEGKSVGTIELAQSVFGIEPNAAVMHQMVVNYLAAQRQGTQSTLTRAEVSGGGRKPWRQKGTGRARQGSTRSPQWTGGGVVFAPTPRDYSFKLNKKEKRAALKSALSDKLANGNLIVVDKIEMNEIKTKTFKTMLDNLKVVGKSLVVINDNDKKVVLSARNIFGCKMSQPGTINVYDILNAKTLVLTQDAVKTIEEVYA